MLLPIFENDGHPLNARCSVVQTQGGWNVIIESRGGAIGAPNERNSDYSLGFSLLIKRLASLGATITSALVDSKELIRRGLSESDRLLTSEALTYPITLNYDNAVQIASELRRAQAAVGSHRLKIGGNTTRRVLIAASLPEIAILGVPFPDFVTGAKALGRISDADLAEAAGEGTEIRQSFDLSSITDARKSALAIIVRRQGQPLFRQELLRAYGGRCAVTGCDAEPVLEAAHIVPYRGSHTNVVGNGLLLRADIHALFDRGLLGIDSKTWMIILHSSLHHTSFGPLDGKRLELPQNPEDIPYSSALQDHLNASGLMSR